MFDYRHGRSSQKMLPDRKRGSKRLDGNIFCLCLSIFCSFMIL